MHSAVSDSRYHAWAVNFVGESPRNDGGKLIKRALNQRYWAGHASVII